MKKLWLAFVMLSLCSMLGTAYAASGGNDRPWHLTGSGTTTVTPSFSSGTFRATHTGEGTFTGTFVVAGFPPPCGVGSVPVTGTNTLTAADGDQINQTTSGTVCQSGPTPTFHTTGTYTNTGGTGRFSTATGTGSQISDVDFPNGIGQPGAFAFTQDGNISY